MKMRSLLNEIKAQQLKNILFSIPLRVLKDTELRILGNRDKFLVRLLEINRKLQKIPRNALRMWKHYVEILKMGKWVNGIRPQLSMNISQIKPDIN